MQMNKPNPAKQPTFANLGLDKRQECEGDDNVIAGHLDPPMMVSKVCIQILFLIAI